MHPRRPNMRMPVPKVIDVKVAHEPEVQGRFPASWDVGLLMSWSVERPWTNTFFIFFAKFLPDFCSMVFRHFFLYRWLEIPRGSVQFYEAISLGWLVLLATSHHSMASPSGQAFVGFQDLKLVAFSIIIIMDFALKVQMLIFAYRFQVRWFSLRLSGSNPVPLKKRKMSSRLLAKVKDERMNDITCHLRMQEPFEWIVNELHKYLNKHIFWHILTMVLQDTSGFTVVCTSEIEPLKWHIFNWSLCLWIWTPRQKALMTKRIIRQFVEWPDSNRLTKSLQIYFSDPSLSSGCSCVKPMLA